MQTIIALPSIASNRFSQCATKSAATSAMRLGSPTNASRAAHLVLSISFLVSSPSIEMKSVVPATMAK